MLTSQVYSIPTSKLNTSIDIDALVTSLTFAHFESVLDAWDEEDRESIYAEVR